jgi:hypothetical protein
VPAVACEDGRALVRGSPRSAACSDRELGRPIEDAT